LLLAHNLKFTIISVVIYLLPDTLNKVALTLTENVSIANPYYLFEITNVQTNKTVTFIAPDISGYTYRYNLFEIRVKTSPDRLNGELDITLGGEYVYNVYEQVSSTNLLVANTGDKLETGILIYGKEATARNEYNRGTTERNVYTRDV